MIQDGNDAQKNSAMDKVALHAITQFARMHPEINPKPEMPAFFKWGAGIAAAVAATGISAGGVWLLGGVAEMRVTLARMDERQQFQAEMQKKDIEDIRRRLASLEVANAGGRK